MFNLDTALYSMAYGAAIAGIFLLLLILVIVAIWLIAHTGKFFTFIAEGSGIAVTKGESYHKSVISFNNHHLEYDDALKADKVTEGEPERKNFLGFLEEYLGIYWVGFWPIFSIYEYEFRWKEWSTTENVYELQIRDDLTSFFFVKTFRYASFLQAAEAKGNVPVDIKFSIFLRIISPQIALFRAEDWFMQLDDYALRRARIYTGERAFDELRTEAARENQTEFSGYIIGLNNQTSKTEDGTMTRLGVEIISAQIIEVDVAGSEEEKRQTLAATTEKYRKEQEGAGIIALGTARATAISAEGKAIEGLGEVGTMLRKQQAVETAGKGGNIVVFTGDNESSELNVAKVAGLVTAQLSKNKGDKQ